MASSSACGWRVIVLLKQECGGEKQVEEKMKNQVFFSCVMVNNEDETMQGKCQVGIWA